MEDRLQNQEHIHPQGRPAPFSGRNRWIKNISAVLVVFCVAAVLAVAGFFSFDRYVWLSHGKSEDYLKIQECIETGSIDGDGQKCAPFFREGKSAASLGQRD